MSERVDPFKEYLADDTNAHFINEDLKDAGRQLARYFMIKLGSASIAYPFETAKILRQCQVTADVETTSPIDDSDDPKQPLVSPIRAAHEMASPEPYNLPKDTAGYVELDEVPRQSQWPIVLDKSRGLGSTSLFIARRQGVLSLWNGLLPFWTHRIAFDVGKATLEETMETSERLSEMIDSRVPVLYKKLDARPGIIPIIAQSISGFILSPLELIHTRMAMQTVYKTEKTYSGTIDAVKKIYHNEGGLRAFFPTPFLTLALKTLQPALRIIPSMFYAQHFEGFSDDASLLESVLLMLGQFACLSLTPLVTIPLETIQRRIYLQSSDVITRVPVAKRRYSGVFDCAYSMLREEGVGSLYQGLSMQLTSNVLMVAVDVATEFEEDLAEDIDEF